MNELNRYVTPTLYYALNSGKVLYTNTIDTVFPYQKIS
jgi:hypothetical protein